MNLAAMVKKYSGGSATATPATPATGKRLGVATVATVAVATDLHERWQWFVSLASEHGIHPDVAAAEFASQQDRLDVIEPPGHDDETLRRCMATLCADARVQDRQREYENGRWVPVTADDPGYMP